MLVANFTSKIPTMGNTKTYEDWSTYLGAKPHRFGVVARLYPQNTINFITDGMRNIFYNDANVGKYQTINSLFFEWEIDKLRRLSSQRNLQNSERMEMRLLWHLRRTTIRSMISS